MGIWSWSLAWYGPLSSTTPFLCQCGRMKVMTMQRSRPLSRGFWAGSRTKFLTCQSQTSIRTGRMAKHWVLLWTAVLQVSPLFWWPMFSLLVIIVAALLMGGGSHCWAWDWNESFKKTKRVHRDQLQEAASCKLLGQEKFWPVAECVIALWGMPHLSFVLGARDKGTNAGFEMEEGLFPRQVPTTFQLQGVVGDFMCCSEIGLQREHRAARSCALTETSVFNKLRLSCLRQIIRWSVKKAKFPHLLIKQPC